MKINIKPDALTYLAKKIPNGKRIFLALDDGSSKFSKLGGSCTIGNKFQLVVADTGDTEYDQIIDNNAGLTLTTAQPELTFLGNGLALDYRNAMLKLTDDSGILDGAVTIADAPEEIVSKKDMVELGGKIC
ncbi:iron-sulfur cluster biosynthesis family protein [Loigolactobacillus coryniformis]|uniref:iron-sulfur cluster biosynthesis family protein n=1 Tax=Loigolactobacillus coryniformis TaxID=1610 RepID=UPI002340A0D4|nr:iron-sulfur cluster biosynthesis family protein [Loigolactobacillus coryniformis]MDC4185274.1 iron-sulfur cluster biosynthesis family protein [Loigolactobacillus coryniformis]